MFAVIKTGGKQYRVQKGDTIEVEKLGLEESKKFNFDQVLLIEDGDKTLIGSPFVENAVVKAVIVENFKDNKVIVFKKKRRKQYRRKTGHRQELTRIKIEDIVAGIKASSKERPEKKGKKAEEKVAPKGKKPATVKKEEIKAKELKEKNAEKTVRKTTSPGSKASVANAEKTKIKTVEKKQTGTKKEPRAKKTSKE